MFVLLPSKIKNKKILCLAQELLSLLAICIRLNVTRISQHMWVNIYTHFKQKFQIPCCFSEEPNLVVKVMNRNFSFSLNEKGVFKDCFLQGALFFSFHSLWVEMLEGRAGWLPQNSLPSLFKLLLLGRWEPVDNSSVVTESKSIKQEKERTLGGVRWIRNSCDALHYGLGMQGVEKNFLISMGVRNHWSLLPTSTST